jgi:hypothetical protein
MVNSRGRAGGADAILAPHGAQRLRAACPDLDNWPRSWHYEPQDLPVGEQIVQLFVPFILDLLDQGLAMKTVRRHRDNLWVLGGEIIRRRHQDEEDARLQPGALLRRLVNEFGGPTVWPRISESEQESLDATCRKLHRFLSESSAPAPPA